MLIVIHGQRFARSVDQIDSIKDATVNCHGMYSHLPGETGRWGEREMGGHFIAGKKYIFLTRLDRIGISLNFTFKPFFST